MIYGDRIRFRAPERNDIPLYMKWFNDPDVRAGLSLFLPMSKAMEEKWFDAMLERKPEEQPFIIEIKEGNGWKPIGTVGFLDIERIARSAELGISIGEKDEWNKGYGTETMELLLKHGFETLNMNRICLRVMSNNLNAIRCYEKAGFIHEGRMREAVYRNGEYLDFLWMSVLRSEWKN